ncbi:hypothetical protein V2K22_00380 [Pseudomonas alliivorans]|nr:hypothetical protein [Pseudomonas alliivorans]
MAIDYFVFAAERLWIRVPADVRGDATAVLGARRFHRLFHEFVTVWP